MKVIGLVAEQHRKALESFLDPDSLLGILEAADISPEKIKELSINIANPEFDLYNNAAELAGAICISDMDDGLADLEGLKALVNTAGAKMIFVADEKRYWDLSPTSNLKIQIGTPTHLQKIGQEEKQEAGIHQITFVRRISEIDQQEFSKRWVAHAPLAQEHHPGLARYTQNHITEQIGSFSDSGLVESYSSRNFDGIAELFFNSLSDMKERMRKDETSEKIIYADINGFLDVKAGSRIYTTQHLLIANP